MTGTTQATAMPAPCSGTGERVMYQRFGRGYYPSLKGRCPACGKWVEVTRTGHYVDAGTVDAHLPKGTRAPRK